MASERFTGVDVAIVDEELGGALFRSADDGQESGHLLTSDQAKGSARWAGQHRPVRIFLFADFTGVFQDENRARHHLFGNPLAQDADFSDHVSSRENCSVRVMMLSCEAGEANLK